MGNPADESGSSGRFFDERHHLVKNYSIVFATRIVAALATLATSAVLSRSFGPARFGEWALLLANAAFLTLVFHSWADAGIVRFGREEFLRRGKTPDVFRARFNMFIVSSGALFLLLPLLPPVMAYWGLDPHLRFFLILYLTVFAGFDSVMAFFLAVGRPIGYATGPVLGRLLCLAAIGGMAWAGTLAPKGAFMALSLMQGMALLMMLLLLKKDLGSPDPEQGKTRDVLKKLWEYGRPMLPVNLASFCLLYGDLFVIKHFLSLDSVGAYGLAYQLFNQVGSALLPLSGLLFPILVTWRIKGQTESVKSFSAQIAPFSILSMNIFLGAGLLIVDGVVRSVFGAAYEGAGKALQMLLVGVGHSLIYTFYSGFLAAYDRLNRLPVITGFQAAFNLILTWVLVQQRGIQGAASATVIALLVFNGSLLITLKKEKELAPHLPALLILGAGAWPWLAWGVSIVAESIVSRFLVYGTVSLGLFVLIRKREDFQRERLSLLLKMHWPFGFHRVLRNWIYMWAR